MKSQSLVVPSCPQGKDSTVSLFLTPVGTTKHSPIPVAGHLLPGRTAALLLDFTLPRMHLSLSASPDLCWQGHPCLLWCALLGLAPPPLPDSSSKLHIQDLSPVFLSLESESRLCHGSCLKPHQECTWICPEGHRATHQMHTYNLPGCPSGWVDRVSWSWDRRRQSSEPP